MSTDTQAFEHRISSALSRLSAAVDAMSRKAAGPGPQQGPDPTADDLAAALEAAEDRLAQTRAELDAQALETQRLRMENVQLRETLRRTAERPDHDLAALQAELEALRSSRLSEISELNEILAELDPLIGDTDDSGQETEHA